MDLLKFADVIKTVKVIVSTQIPDLTLKRRILKGWRKFCFTEPHELKTIDVSINEHICQQDLTGKC
jgi:hypothetical protein